MAIPTIKAIAPVILKILGEHDSIHRLGVVKHVERHFDLTEEERNEKIPSGVRKIRHRTMWASVPLKNADLLERPSRGHIKITQAGRDLLPNLPELMDHHYFMKFQGYRAYMKRRNAKQSTAQIDKGASDSIKESMEDASPEENIAAIRDEIHAALASDLHDQIMQMSPKFFEQTTLELLKFMGYAGAEGRGNHLGGPGDEGVDVVIEQDALGLDKIYIQAKRHQNPIGASKIRDFSGALNMKQVNKGVFITTSGFTDSAKEAAAKLSQHIVLIDGEDLVQLMIRYNVGCRVDESYEIKKLEEAFFTEN